MFTTDFEAEKVVISLIKLLKQKEGLSLEDMQEFFRISRDEALLLLREISKLLFLVDCSNIDGKSKLTVIENVSDSPIFNIPVKYSENRNLVTFQKASEHNAQVYELLRKRTCVKENIKELLLDCSRVIILLLLASSFL